MEKHHVGRTHKKMVKYALNLDKFTKESVNQEADSYTLRNMVAK